MAYAIVAVIILIIDQAVKYWTTLNIAMGDTQAFIPGILELTNLHNSGAAYGLFSEANARWIFVALTIVFSIVIIWALSKNVIAGKMGRWTIVLVLAGGLGNCIDRIINGEVVDMFHFILPLSFPVFNSDYPVFNLADMFISICGVLFCIWLIFHKRPKKEKVGPKVHETHDKPVRTPDYMAQMEKPVAEAKIELSRPAVKPATPAQQPNSVAFGADTFSDWNIPESSAASAPAPVPAQQPKPATAKKPGDEFSLDSIMAEFKDL
ncbi:MAG: signal peptidase II [Clostridia bacterium]|nr:signal peptidase II [Clostridia bacterium]